MHARQTVPTRWSIFENNIIDLEPWADWHHTYRPSHDNYIAPARLPSLVRCSDPGGENIVRLSITIQIWKITLQPDLYGDSHSEQEVAVNLPILLKVFTNHDINLLQLDEHGRVRSQITSVVLQMEWFDFDCNLVLTRKLIIYSPSALHLTRSTACETRVTRSVIDLFFF